MVQKRICAGKTKAGTQCKLPAGGNGFCHLHDPENAAARELAAEQARAAAEEQWKQGENLRDLVNRFTNVAQRMGWSVRTDNIDRETWKHASLNIRRSVRKEYAHETVTAFIEITMDKYARFQVQKTSWSSYGIAHLERALRDEFNAIPWLKPVPKNDKKKPTPDENVLQLLTRFHQVAVQLRRRHRDRQILTIEDEYDVQDLLHALLRSRYDDIRAEEYTPSYGGASSRLDFLLKKEKVVIECKYASSHLRDKQVGEQLIVDIERYQAHPACRTLFCLVYDPNHELRNPAGLEADLSGNRAALDVTVVVVPK